MFYIFHGPDDFSATEEVARRKAELGDPASASLNITELDGKTLSLGELTRHARAIPFLSPRRLVIVYHYLSRIGDEKNARALEQLADLLQSLPATTDLIFVETTDLKASHPILKLGQRIEGCVRHFGAPPRERLPAWIENRVRQKGGQIEYRAVLALANVVGDDLRALNNELDKLTLYVGNARPITLADVELLCPYTADSETFAMANAIGRRDARTALDQLHRRLEEGQHPLQILGGIAAQFRGLLEVKSMAAAGLTPAQIARKKGWKSDYAAKMRLQEARNFSLERLLRIFDLLLATDRAIKTGELDQTLALDTLISRLCDPAARENA